MKRFRYPFFPLSLLLIILIAGPSMARAHGTASRAVEAGNLAAVEFTYSDGEPMAYAEVQVFSPEDRKMEYQIGRTDKYGNFAFRPGVSGEWLITADDGMGHLCRATVETGPGLSSLPGKEEDRGSEAAAPSVVGSRTIGVIAGMSLILNMALLAQLFRQRAKRAKERP